MDGVGKAARGHSAGNPKMRYVMDKGELKPWAEVAAARRARAKAAEIPKGPWHGEVDRYGQPIWEPGTLRAWDRVESKRSSLPCPAIISDTLDGVMNPVDGKTYDSKSAYYQAVKDAGCEIVGNEMPRIPYAAPDVKAEEIGAALNKVKQGYKPELEYENDG
jgi:hypothetical protein